MILHKTDVLVIGAGPSGAIAAAFVQKNGLDVTVVEKSHFPRFVIGESLLPSCMAHLEEAGFMDVLKKEHFQLKLGARFVRDDKEFFFQFSDKYTEGWDWTWQVHREVFDKVLTDELERRGVDIWFGHSVEDVEFQGSASTSIVMDEKGEKKAIQAKFIIDASGYGRVIARKLNMTTPSEFPVRKAMFAHLKDAIRPDDDSGRQATFVVLEQDLWMWIIPFSNGEASIGFVGDKKYFEACDEKGFLKMMEGAPKFYERFKEQPFALSPRSTEGYTTGVTKTYGKGFALAGNSAEFLDPIFSSGVALGIETGRLAGILASREIKGEVIDWDNEFEKHVEAGVDAFRSYVKYWYDGSMQAAFFDANVFNPNIKRQLCSVLAGYVWDRSNPFVRKHKKAMKVVRQIIQLYS